MGKLKEMFMKDAEQAFSRASMLGLEHLIEGSEARRKREEADEIFNTEEETVEFDKGNYKTVVKVRFNSKGYPILHYVESTLKEEISQQNTQQKLNDLINQAVEQKDFRAALIYQTQLDNLQKPA